MFHLTSSKVNAFFFNKNWQIHLYWELLSSIFSILIRVNYAKVKNPNEPFALLPCYENKTVKAFRSQRNVSKTRGKDAKTLQEYVILSIKAGVFVKLQVFSFACDDLLITFAAYK